MTLQTLTPALTTPMYAHPHIVRALESSRNAFRQLAAQVNAANGQRKSTQSKRSLRAIVAHMVMSLEMMVPMMITRTRAGKKTAMPGFFATGLGNWISYTLSERRAKRDDLATLISAYDRAHDALLTTLAGLRDQDLALHTELHGHYLSVEAYLVDEIAAHIALHRSEIEVALIARK